MKAVVCFALLIVAQSGCAQEIPPTAEIGPPPWEAQDTELSPRLYEPRPGQLQRWDVSLDPGRDYGVDTRSLGHGPKIRASDPDTLARVREEQRKCPGPNCPKKPDEEKKPVPPQGPIRRLENDIGYAATIVVALLLFLAGVILLTRRKS